MLIVEDCSCVELSDDAEGAPDSVLAGVVLHPTTPSASAPASAKLAVALGKETDFMRWFLSIVEKTG